MSGPPDCAALPCMHAHPGPCPTPTPLAVPCRTLTELGFPNVREVSRHRPLNCAAAA